MPAANRKAHRAPRPAAGSRPRSLAALVLGPLICTLALTALAFIGLSIQAQHDTQARLNLAALAARESLSVNMGDLVITNGQIASSLPANVTTLNSNQVEAQFLRTQTGFDTLITQREGSGQVVIASSLRASNGSNPEGMGESLNGDVASAACSAGGGSGLMSLDGVSYLARSAPLLAGSGGCLGAVVALEPVTHLLATPLQLTVIVAMAGALLTLTTVAMGLSFGGRGAEPEADKTERINAAMARFATAEAAWATQLAQRDMISRKLATGGRRLQRMMATMAQDRIALQDSAADIWAGMSHPGAPMDPGTAFHLAREGAVVAARIGSRLHEFDAFTDALLDDLAASREVDAMLANALTHAEEALAALRTATGDQAEAAAAPIDSEPNMVEATVILEDVYDTNSVEAQRRYTREAPAYTPEPMPRPSGSYRAVRPDSASQRAAGAPSNSDQMPSVGQSQHGHRPINPGASGIQRHPGLDGTSGRYRASNGQQQRMQPPPRQPRNRPNTPPDGRDRDASGSRWLND